MSTSVDGTVETPRGTLESVTRPDVEVRRSARRRRTVSAYRDGPRIVVLVPQRFSRAEEARWVEAMVADVQAREARARRRGPRAGDAPLQRRAEKLAARHLSPDVLPVTIRWVSTMRLRWASCTPTDRSIRISERLRDMPGWVLDYVIVHELAHIVAPGHDEQFWKLVDSYPMTERARGYLEGFAAARTAAATDSATAGESADSDPDSDPEDDLDVLF